MDANSRMFKLVSVYARSFESRVVAFELDLDRVAVNHHSKYLGHSKVVARKYKLTTADELLYMDQKVVSNYSTDQSATTLI